MPGKWGLEQQGLQGPAGYNWRWAEPRAETAIITMYVV